MPRRPRIHLPGIPQHVIQRGVDRLPVFFSDEDCQFYLDWLGEYLHKRHIKLHAYCLMTNHVHLLLSSPSADSLGGLMQRIKRGQTPLCLFVDLLPIGFGFCRFWWCTVALPTIETA